MTLTQIDPKYYEQAAANGIKRRTFEARVYTYKWTPERASTEPPTPTADRYRGHVAEIQRRRAGEVEPVRWTPEQIEAHLAKIGPDKNWEAFHNPKKIRETAITAQRQKLNGTYFKPGEAW